MKPSFLFKPRGAVRTASQMLTGLLLVSFLFSPYQTFAEEQAPVAPESTKGTTLDTAAVDLLIDSLLQAEDTSATPSIQPEGEGEGGAPMALLSGDNGSQLDVGKTPVNANLKLEPNAFDGSLQYEFPLTIPPGRNGLQPSLKLQYSSRPSHESNLFGYGWTISIPYIERRNYMGVDELYDHQAFYSSLSGELASTSVSTVYKAKVETGDYLNYTFSGNTWTVTDKAGTTYKFGHASSTQQYVASSTQQVYKWMLQEVRDTNDNYITYSYTKDSNQIYPDVITYTGSGATPGNFDVHFTKELRSDIATSTAEGFEVVTKYRISEVKAEVNDSWVRKYTLGYSTGDNGQRSALTSITEAGYDGSSTVTLPAVTFDYQDSVDSWTQNGSWDVTVPFVSSGYADTGVRIAEANGDGLPDLLRSDGNNNEVLLNTGSGWTITYAYSNPIVYKVDDVVHPGNILVDINGDGRTDIAKSIENSATSTIYMNTGSGWSLSSSTVPVAFAKSNGGDNGVRVADVNGDGLPDLVRNHAGDGPSTANKTYINNGSTWVLDTTWTLPEATILNDNTTDPGTRIVDINGDGLADVIRRDETVNVVYLNNGSGWTQTPSWTVPVKLMDSGDDQGVRLEDVNGDNLVDLIQRNASANAVYLNTGSGWTLDSSWSVPHKIVDSVSSVLVDAGSRFGDFNGDGLLDQLNYVQGGTDYAYFRNGEKPELLATSTNQFGGTTSITYKASPEYSSLNPYTPFALDTVQKVLYNDGIGTWDTEYTYQDGIYYSDSIRDRKFAGFGVVTATDDLGYVTKQYFHQGSTTSSTIGEYSDHISKIGKVFRTEAYDGSSNLYSKTINKWDRYDRGDGSSFVKLAEVLDFSYDGDSDHKEKAEAYTYNNSYGNTTLKVSYGEVSGSNDGTFSDSGSDKFSSAFTYATSTATSSVYKLSQETVTDQSSNKVREKKLYYDTLSFGSLNKGNPTKEEQWKTGSTYIDLEKTYNGYGLVTQDKDARDKITSYVYDALNLYPATTTNPLSQTVQRLYDYSSGKVATTTDANGRVFVNVYDSLDRVVAEKQPDLTTPSTLVTKIAYQYSDTVFPRKVQKTSYLGTSTSTEMYSFVDGYGKKLQDRTEVEDANTYAIKDYRYDSRGLLKTESLPYFATGTTYTGTSSPPTATLLQRYLYDPLQRVSAAGNNVGTTTYAYDDWKVTSTDAEGSVKDLLSDAYGNLKQVIEHNGGSSYTTSYEYNGNNKLTKITDDAGNVRNLTYNGLGHRLTIEDLHDTSDGTFGTWTYTYDDTGNVSSVVDPKSQTVDFTYDDVNRVLTENYTGSAGTEITYTYDSCSEGIGHLCTASSTDAVSAFTYNAIGLPVTQTRTIGGVAYVTSYAYDRLGNITTLTYPDNSQVAYSHNGAGQLEGISQKEGTGSFTPIVSDFDYAPTGKVSYKELGNGVSSTYTFDATKLYRLTNILTVATSSGESLLGGGGMGFASDPYESLAQASEETYVANVIAPLPVAGIFSYAQLNFLPEEELLPIEDGVETLIETPPLDIASTTESTNILPEESLLIPDVSGEVATTTDLVVEAPVVSTTTATTTPEIVKPIEIIPVEPPALLAAAPGLPAEEDARTKIVSLGVNEVGESMYKASIYTSDTLYIDRQTGALADIDTYLHAGISGWDMTKAPYTAHLSNTSGSKAVTFRTGDTELYFAPLSEKEVLGELQESRSGQKVVYPDAIGAGVDMEITLDTTSLRKDAVLRTKASLNSLKTTEEFAEVPFLMQASEPIDISVGGKSIQDAGPLTTGEEAEVIGKNGTVAYLWPPVAVDAEGNSTPIEITYATTTDGIILTKHLPLKWLESAVFPVRTDVVVSYYAVEDGDGEVYKGGNSDWSTVHNASTGTADRTSTTANVKAHKIYRGNLTLYRFAVPFNTSALPDDAIITAANLKVYVDSKNDDDNDGNDFIRVVQNTTYSATNLESDDYDQIGSVSNPTAGASDIDIGTISTNAWLTFSLNSTGRGWINKTGYTKLGLREGHDAVNDPVTDSTTTGINIRTANYGGSATSSDPVLEVTYHVNNAPTAPSGPLTEGFTNPSSITDSTPEFSAIFEDSDVGDVAHYYRLQVATSSSFTTTYWDTTKTALASSTPAGMRIADISYTGSALASSTPYYWRIKYWDTDDFEGAWSATSTFALAMQPGDLIQDISFTYDKVGNITQIVDVSENVTEKTIDYTYDDLNRLLTASTTAAVTDPYSYIYTYSSLGNISSSTPSGSYTYAETGYANPHAPTTINGVTLSYDNNGNVATYAPWTYGWDYRNRMTSAGDGTATSTYKYDENNQRVSKLSNSITTVYPNQFFNKTTATTTKHIYAGEDLIATIEGNGTATTTQYLHTDHLNSPSIITDSSGSVIQTTDYYPYGSTRVDTGSFDEQRQYIGQEYDGETDLSYLNARYYDGDRGQFTGQDPVFWEIGQTTDGRIALQNPQLQNSYSYSLNNPITNKDPQGRCPICVPVAIGASVGFVGGIGSQAVGDYLTGDFGNYSITQNISRYSVAGGQGGVVGAGVVVAGAAAAAAGLTTFATTLVVGGTAGTLTAGTTAAGNVILGQEIDPTSLAINSGISAVTAGTLSTLPKVPGRMPNLGTKAFFTGSHTQRQASEEFLSGSMQNLGQTVYQTSSATLGQIKSILKQIQGAINSLSRTQDKKKSN